MKEKLCVTTSGAKLAKLFPAKLFPFDLINLCPNCDHVAHSPDMRVLKTGQGVVEYLRLEGSLPTDQILNIAKSVLLLSEKKINALYL